MRTRGNLLTDFIPFLVTTQVETHTDIFLQISVNLNAIKYYCNRPICAAAVRALSPESIICSGKQMRRVWNESPRLVRTGPEQQIIDGNPSELLRRHRARVIQEGNGSPRFTISATIWLSQRGTKSTFMFVCVRRTSNVIYGSNEGLVYVLSVTYDPDSVYSHPSTEVHPSRQLESTVKMHKTRVLASNVISVRLSFCHLSQLYVTSQVDFY